MSRRLLVVVAAALAAVNLAADADAQDVRATLTVKLRNDAGVSSQIVTPAQDTVRRVFAAAGVDVLWEGASMMMVVLSSNQPAELSRREDVLGFAVGAGTGRGRVAYVVISHVRTFVRESPRAEAAVLGAAIAHEIGHLLLPHDSHARSGLMRPTFRLRDFANAHRGNLDFTADQATTVRSAVEHGRATLAAAPESSLLQTSFNAVFAPIEMNPGHEAGH